MQDTTRVKNSAELSELELIEELKRLRTQIPDNPSLNPILNVAFDLSRRLESQAVSFDSVKNLAGRLMDRACVRRARRLREKVGYVDQATTLRDFTSYVEKTANEAAGSIEAFAQRWSRARTGIVLTAHPTFGLSDALYRRMVEIAVADPSTKEVTIGVPHRPEETLTLHHEHKCVQDAIRNLRNAYEELLHAFFSVASQKFGEAAFKLRPKLATIASWVGYDLDGRNDISWTFSFHVRLKEKRAALADIRERFVVLKHKLDDADGPQRIARQIVGKLDLGIAAVDEQIKALEGFEHDPNYLAKAANVITKTDGYNLLTVEPLLTLFEHLIDSVEAPQVKRAIAALAGLVSATGLGTSHIHLRINALQLNNAFRAYVHEPWTRDLTERQSLARIVDMIKNCPHETVNFSTLDLETATAIRQFALTAQIQKHVDKETPIRFLIAEAESPATILIAVFFAKLFGVDHITDISPLFETPSGLENGARIMERLVEEDTYRDYVQGRKRLSIQTGFSDAGRFIGQIPATLAIERYYDSLSALVAKAKLQGVETLIFSTHGESMGRGAHPGDLHQRLHYLMTDESRRRFADARIPVKHETSFQGGDGYMVFGNRALTTRALATVVIDGEIPDATVDPFYTEQNFNLDFFLRLRAFQQKLFAHEGYRAVLGAFGANLLFKTGSRPVKRQGEHTSDRGNPARMRAIPNNAILQQFGYLANVVAGLGIAVGSEVDHFNRLARSSKRLQSMLAMVAHAKTISSLNAMGANAKIFDAGFWAARAAWGREQALNAAFRTLATHLLPDDRESDIAELVHLLRLDAIDLHAILTDLNIEDGMTPDENRLELDLLQAIRLAVMMRIFILAAQLPRFTPQDGLSHAQVLEMALGLDIPEVLTILRKAFPHSNKEIGEKDEFDEQASYRPRGINDYGRLETEILTPMENSYEFVREIGTGISHHFGAFG
ncbi:phosphoenolpyruvate carboxylase [Hyphomicrobium denitrificans 1NES1]|uniref:Phosphoenolpyruvate carboxylase n=1 Tax=Hyphomicrobium denitrificans 1NES1 TaxID=670307 RepID=N0BH48_9HYPH|nr:phosphoenolpyruvate carboxylase [Hyphomicrobium denitrificans]AGK59455.1 phosphoenolpyruvate carboxylase [Hyphomicrobium denitrificans 1NES1]